MPKRCYVFSCIIPEKGQRLNGAASATLGNKRLQVIKVTDESARGFKAASLQNNNTFAFFCCSQNANFMFFQLYLLSPCLFRPSTWLGKPYVEKPGIPMFFPTPIATGGLLSQSCLIQQHVQGQGRGRQPCLTRPGRKHTCPPDAKSLYKREQRM